MWESNTVTVHMTENKETWPNFNRYLSANCSSPKIWKTLHNGFSDIYDIHPLPTIKPFLTLHFKYGTKALQIPQSLL